MSCSNCCWTDHVPAILVISDTRSQWGFYIWWLVSNGSDTGSSTAGDEEAPAYKDAFPPLPEKAASPEGTQEPVNAWTSKIRPLKSSVITQVATAAEFTQHFVALEE